MKTKKASFIHLHSHTQFSLLDGMNRIEALVKRAGEFGMPALAITDHGNMFGAIEFYLRCLEAGLKPIIGCEIYVAPGSMRQRSGGAGDSNHHLTLLAATNEGYRNLLRLVSQAHLEGFYYKPRVDKELLAELSAGLVALSGCLKGEIASCFAGGRPKDAARAAGEYSSIFQPGCFFLELQDTGVEGQRKANEGMTALAREMGLPLVATNDCHYLDRGDAAVHDVLLCIGTGKNVDDPDRMKMTTDLLYFRSPAEMEEVFGHLPESLANTLRIAEMCNVGLEFDRLLLPHYQPPEGMSLAAYLRRLALEGLNEKLRQVPDEAKDGYRRRLEYELDVIEKMGFPGYFLIVWDFIKYARDRGIPVGPGRGSAAGSLTAYVLNITQIDPIVHGLIFERFLNPGRVSMPDIDVDFSMDRRDEVIEYVRRKYGQDRVAQIITFGTLMAKGVIRDVGRVLNMPYGEVDRIAKLVPNDPKITLDRALHDEPRLKELAENDEQIARLIEYARSLEGLSRHASTHAAGVVIAKDPLTEFVPLYRGTRDEVVTQYPMKEIEKIGLLKFDFLGLRTLTVIQDAVNLINRDRGEQGPLNLNEISLDDPGVYRLLSAGETAGIFQMESAGMTDLTIKLKPSCFADLVALISLYRPGPLNMADDFVKRKHGKVAIKYPHAMLENILRETYGVILYQEQVMRIASDMAGFSLADADLLRRAMGKKKPEEMAKQREKFVKGAQERAIKKKTAEEIFDQMDKFAGYGFNKSHSAAYAVIAFQTAWLKAHYPLEFMAALLSSESQNTDKVVQYIKVCREMNITVLPPDVNGSQRSFTVHEGAVRFGLAAVKNVGETAIESIVGARERIGRFTGLRQVCREVDTRKVNKRVIEALIKAGAFDFTGANRAALLAGVDVCMESSQQVQRDRQVGQGNMFEIMAAQDDDKLPDVEPMPEHKLLAFEKESLGFYITGHPLARFADKISLYSSVDTASLSGLKDGTTFTIGGMIESLTVRKTKKGENMAVGLLEDTSGSVEVVIFPKVYASSLPALEGGEPVLVTGKLNLSESTPRIHAAEIIPLSQAADRVAKNIHLKLIATGLAVEDLKNLKEIILRNRGESTLTVHLIVPEHSETILDLGRDMRVKPGDGFLADMAARFGPDAVSVR